MKKYIFLFTLSLLGSACSDDSKPVNIPETPKTEALVPSLNYTITQRFAHDTMAFTEGLVFHEGQLFESTGAPEENPLTRSTFGIVDLKTGKIDVKAELDRNTYFGEGIAFFKDKVYQLTYKNKIGFIYDAKSFKNLGRFSYKNEEGWGMTTDGTHLIMSDGSNLLTYLDPETLKEVKTLNVTNGGYAEDYLNELEFINGFIYSNVWMKNYIVKIDPATGKTVGILDLSALTAEAKAKYDGSSELNGIAFEPLSGKFYVTGKMWPVIFEIEVGK
ncbi:MAG: glutaminyl-peptide cyclotransferase [Bacteroidota bacterium]|nr:glutaminyl-peptide cyclotransferase [Bacteroidota bacterium]